MDADQGREQNVDLARFDFLDGADIQVNEFCEPLLRETFIVSPPPTIATTSLPNATAKQSYTTTLQVTTGTGVAPYKWSLMAGSKLPAGLTLKATTGVISGKPTKATTTPASFTVKVTDARKQFATQALTLTVN